MKTGGLRFLVVEDHGFQRWLVANMLEGLGAECVISAGDGQAALELLSGREPPIDVIVTDLDMPGMDGMEFIRHLGTGGSRASLIVASGLESALIASVDVMARAYGVSLLGTIEKPVTPGKLSAMLESLVRGPGAREDADTQAFTLEEIAEGLERNQFEPFFQPKVDLRTRVMKGAEALARWRHPTLGIIRPAAFVAAMEKGGMIDHLTRVIIEGAILNCAMWRAGRLDAGVAINLSPRSLQDFGFINWLIDGVHRAGLEPGHVTFEITESVALGSLGASLETLSRLRMRGFGLSIDDYGTGHSSMERLSQIPFTELKIDQGFVRKAATEASSRAILESSLEMAQKLGITAVAEGVESTQEWDLVRTLGCDLAQGYLIAPPMDAVEFARWVRTPLQIRA